ncbi:hypothetical protein [Streptomyces sp. NPDC048332]|uniref:hypothetical protein n=1 Tax=Streptomyces sp. NPDC048332 TaxID=3154619 RepID=UPI0034228C57
MRMRRRLSALDVRLTEAAVIRPGDTVLIRIPSAFTDAQRQIVRKALERELPDVSVVIVSGTDSMHVYRPAGD